MSDLDNLLCAGTYKKILQEIARPVLAGAEIRFNTNVTAIMQRMADNDKVQLVLERDTILSVDEVVVTSPLGWLKQNLEAFKPPLPARMAKAINSIQYGCLEKVSHSTAR